MLRVFCSTNYCGLLDAQHCRDRQAIATLEDERDAAIAQAAALAEDNARLRAELDAAREGHAFYMGMYAEEKAAHAPQCPQDGRSGAKLARGYLTA